MTILDWLSSSVRYSFDKTTFEAIIESRELSGTEELATITNKEKELLIADTIFTAVMLSPSSTASQSASHNNYQRTIGSETDLYQSSKISYALGIYKKYDDPKYDILANTKGKIKLLKIVDVV
jgi:hypothetical protein